MPKKIIVRREGRYIQTLPHEFTAVRDWFRKNSPEPRYPEHAKKFTLEIVGGEEEVPAIAKDGKLKTITFEQYANKFAPHEDININA